ncbi:Esa1p-associated factor [Malassezia caprae]|uniref:Chromatin modification-related protein EAF3 n=1 Tax=Malassezia caprae TaxID=1381934 RepID=A0AAF0E5S3_9BASI|nr:Esa1p-associated factor [Malassezia caprae]
MQYHQDEKVLCFHGPLIYQAKVRSSSHSQILLAENWKESDNQSGATGPHYFVHYQGWKKTWDEWVPEMRLLKLNEENLARQKALVDAQKAEAAAAAAVAAAHEQGARSKADGRRAPSSAGAAGGGRGSKRSRDTSECDGNEKRPDLRLHVPDSLKAALVDDWENVTRKEQLVPLPRTPNVKEILKDYAEHYKATSQGRAASRSHASPILDEVLAGLKLYFDKSLAQNLLYRFERRQYVELRKQLGSKAGDGVDAEDAKPAGRRGGRGGAAKPPPSESPTAAELEASEVYGAEHLLRLFVNLPGIVAHTSMDPESVAILREHLNEFLLFLAKEQARLFVREYEEPSPAYHRLSST